MAACAMGCISSFTIFSSPLPLTSALRYRTWCYQNLTRRAPSMTDPPQHWPTVRLRMRVLGEPVAVEAPMPPERVRLDEVLPLLHKIDDHAVGLAVRRSEAEGKTVSCRKGCSACCRTGPVPVTPPEAYALLRLVENL